MCIFVMAWCWICHLKTSRGTLNAIFFPNCRRTLRSYHSARFLLKIVTENCCPTSEICFLFLFWNLQRQFSDFSILTTILSQKLIIIDNWKPKNCVKSQILPKIGIRKLDKVVKSQILPKVGIMKLENQWKAKTKRKLERKPNFIFLVRKK